MKKSLVMWWMLAVLVSTALQGAILVWLYGACPTLFWASVALLVASVAVFAYFVFIRVGVRESLKYLWDYWFLTLSK